MSRLLIHNLSFIAINCIKLRFRIATVQLENFLMQRMNNETSQMHRLFINSSSACHAPAKQKTVWICDFAVFFYRRAFRAESGTPIRNVSRHTGGSSSSRATYRDISSRVFRVHFTSVMRRLLISIQVIQLGCTQLPVLK